MAEMVSVKLPKKRKSRDIVMPADHFQWPFGLRLRLENEQLDKLKIELPDVGDMIRVDALGEVVEVSQHEDGKDKRKSVEIQIKKLGLGKGVDNG